MPEADPAAHGQDPYDDCALNLEPWSVPGVHVRKRHFWEVRFEYDPPVIELLKRRVPGVRWDPHRRAWIVDEDLGGRLLEALSEMSRLVIARSPAAAEEEATVTYLFAEGWHPQVGDLIQWPSRPANEVVTATEPGPIISADLLEQGCDYLGDREGEAGVWVTERPASVRELADRHSVFVVGS